MAEVFISYKSERRAAAEHLAEVLERHSYSVWFDYGLIKGDDFDFQLDMQLRDAKAVIVLWCSMSVESRWVSREASLAANLKTLLPTKIEECDLKLAHFTADYVDLRSWDGSPRSHTLDELFQELTRLTGRAPQPDWAALSEYEKTWRRFGALPLQAFALGKPVVRPKETDSPPSPIDHTPTGISPQEAYNAIKDSEHIEDWENFLEIHGDSRLAIGAKARLRQLKTLAEEKHTEHEQAIREAEAAEVWRHLQDYSDVEAFEDFLHHFKGTKAFEESFLKGYVVAEIGSTEKSIRRLLKSGDVFQDHEHGPEMVVIPAGKFMMGSPANEERWPDYDGREEPQHEVTIAKPLAVGRYAITVEEFTTFIDETGHDMPDEMYTYENNKWESRKGKSYRNPGFEQTVRHPVIGVNWIDAQAYIKWLNEQTGKTYRLLSEAEWEYACRAGSATPFWWGTEISTDQANYNGNYVYGDGVKGEYREKTVAVDSFAPNPWGLYQVHGNVWEWVEDHWHENYEGAPIDGSVWQGGDASYCVLRGGSWNGNPRDLRSAYRLRNQPGNRVIAFGFRLARTLNL